jgi:hypothetical protein
MRRRRPAEEAPQVRQAHALVDSSSWPLCRRYDGRKQPCWCWFEARHSEVGADAWPGGEAAHFIDFINVTQRHECNALFVPAAAGAGAQGLRS